MSETWQPTRIEMSNKAGWRMQDQSPDGRPVAYIGRGSVYHNVGVCWGHGCYRKPCGCCPVDDSYCCLDSFREYVLSGIEGRPSCTGSFRFALDGSAGYPRRDALVAALPRLRGKHMACWCALDKPCHAEVLTEMLDLTDE